MDTMELMMELSKFNHKEEDETELHIIDILRADSHTLEKVRTKGLSAF